jgi:hypothetical protein
VPRRHSDTFLWKCAASAVLTAQLAWLVVESTRLFGRFSLTSDFALFFQAWHLVAAGHLAPAGTIYHSAPFLTNHFELLVYPLSIFEFLDPGGLVLLVLADLATVAAELVAFFWILDLVAVGWRGGERGRRFVVSGALLVLALDPWIWWANAFDFHLEVFATLFGLLAARALWRGKWQAGAAWAAVTLCCGTVESFVLIGVGLALVLSRRDLWRQGIALGAAAVAWVLSLNALGYDSGSQLTALYGYLTNPAPGTTVHVTQVALGVLRHPHRAAAMLISKRAQLWQILGGASLLGVASSIGFAISLVLLLPAGLNAEHAVVDPEASFQFLPVLLFVPIGSVIVLCWLSRRPKRAWHLAGALLGVAALIETVTLSLVWVPRSDSYFRRTDPAAARVLSGVLARTPPGAEVIASNGFVGRFADRPWIYSYWEPTSAVGSVPVKARTVEFVLSASQGIETTPPGTTQVAIAQIRHRLHAELLVHSAGIWVFLWHPAPGVHRVRFPGLGL